jgi:hypothetical protein
MDLKDNITMSKKETLGWLLIMFGVGLGIGLGIATLLFSRVISF